jgi:hypothetical protein
VRAAALAAPLAALALLTPVARGDGDPASDYLPLQSTYLSAAVPPAQARQIVELLARAAKAGFSLKVAVIAGPQDLGADPELFAKPQIYAKFLATEDRYVLQNELLVVMPNGYGVYKLRGLPPGDAAAVARLPRPGRALASATERAIRALAAQHSISLRSGGGFPDWAIVGLGIAAAVIASLIAVPVVRRRPDVS